MEPQFEGFEDESKQVLLKCTHPGGAEVQWDSKWYRIAAGEVRKMNETIAAHFQKVAPDRVERVTGNEGTVQWAKSRLETAKRQHAEAQDLLAKAKDLVAQREKELKIAQARVDAETANRVKEGLADAGKK